MDGIVCQDYVFYNNFDSANLARVEIVPKNESVAVTKCDKPKSGAANVEIPDAEFNIWTRPDCWGTEFENGNRTWFYFGLRVPHPSLLLRFNLIDLNRQGKMYSQGMAPVYRISPGKTHWDRIRDKPTYAMNDDIFTLTFKFRTMENTHLIYYFAFTYPFSCLDLEKMLVNIDSKYLTMRQDSDDDIYYVRESICRSLEGRSIDLITISSFHGISYQREDRLANLFRTRTALRPFKFHGKKIIFVSARVHPGETPSSFVFNGFLHLLLNKEDPVAQQLRRMYVFKLIPFLNPDGVARGHYRTDTRGVNLNRVYRNPCLNEHPSIYAARSLIRYYHFGCEKEDFVDKCDNCNGNKIIDHLLTAVENQANQENISKKVSTLKLNEELAESSSKAKKLKCKEICSQWREICRNCGCRIDYEEPEPEEKVQEISEMDSEESRLFLYIDLHGHASKKGIFMYGNHFDDLDRQAECMLFPKIMSLNNHNFHFNSCNFTERNMYLKDKRDGMSRAGSGRVAVLSLTGIIRSYTLECNYNSGRIVNVLPAAIRESSPKPHTLSMPPKYTPQIFEEVGKAMGASILDLTGHNPCTRIPNSEFHSLAGLREWLKTTAINEFAEMKVPKLKAKKSGSMQSSGQVGYSFRLKKQAECKRFLLPEPNPSKKPPDLSQFQIEAKKLPIHLVDSDKPPAECVEINQSISRQLNIQFLPEILKPNSKEIISSRYLEHSNKFYELKSVYKDAYRNHAKHPVRKELVSKINDIIDNILFLKEETERYKQIQNVLCADNDLLADNIGLVDNSNESDEETFVTTSSANLSDCETSSDDEELKSTRSDSSLSSDEYYFTTDGQTTFKYLSDKSCVIS